MAHLTDAAVSTEARHEHLLHAATGQFHIVAVALGVVKQGVGATIFCATVDCAAVDLYLPLLLPGTLSAALLVFVDVLKEMPATLLMRPFGWDTLAVRIFEMTSEGEWARASLPALTLVLVGLLPVIGLIRRSAHRIG